MEARCLSTCWPSLPSQNVTLSFELLILFSALVGAQMVTLALGLSPLWTLVLAVVGVIIQLGLARSFRYDWRRRRVRPFYRRRLT